VEVTSSKAVMLGMTHSSETQQSEHGKEEV